MPRGGFETGRLFGPDLARGIALLGMFAAHVVVDRSENVYDGRSSILFATIAGVSLGLLTGGSAPPDGPMRVALRGGVAIRGLALIVVGVFLIVVFDPPLRVILDAYGFAFVLLAPLILLPRRWLIALAAGIVIIAPGLVAWLTTHTDAAELPEILLPFAEWLVYGTYPMAIWLAFPLVGLVCARSGLEHTRTRAFMIGGGLFAALTGYGSAALLPGVDAAAHSGSVAEVVGSGGVAVAIIGAATVLGDVPGRAGRGIRLVLFPVAAAGSMALTIYTAQAIGLAITRNIVSGGAEVWFYPEPTLAVLILATLVIATLWRVCIGAGPLERLLRLLSTLPPPRRVRT
ncbi:MAG TPA: DUF418 domain-containing protein [Pseudolysinimonas sp.]|nr:DUF418 domain-containing protein [Pseudolysinimonas sp.]